MEALTVGKIAVHEFITIDGVFEDPSFTFDYPFDPKMGVAIARIMGSSKAILLGRRTHEMFAPGWSVRTAADDPGAPFMNESPKYVVSGSLKDADYWNNSTVIGAYSADSIRRIKDQVDGNIYVSGRGTLVRAMLADGLVDELELFVFPVAIGKGARLFNEKASAIRFALVSTEAYNSGVVHLSYRTAGSSAGLSGP